MQRTHLGTKITQCIQSNEKFYTVSCAPFKDGYRQYSSLSGGSQFNNLVSSVKGVSSQGMKKGRARQKKFHVKWMGENKAKGRKKLEFKGLYSESRYRDKEKIAEPEKSEKKKRKKVYPIERGYSGSRFIGMKYPPPNPIGDYDFAKHGFESVIIERKQVKNMTASVGRVRSFRIVAIVGNRNGLVGYGVGKGKDPKATMEQAILKAAKHQEYVERYENRTVLHNMYYKEIATKVFIIKKHHGYGLVCQRIIKSICELAGIKDLYAKIEGPKTPFHIIKAVFAAFRRQKTYQKLADKYNLHVVEKKKEYGNRPFIIASPKNGEIRETIPEELQRGLDFENMFWNRKVMYVPPRKKMFYEDFRGHKKKQAIKHRYRNQDDAKMKRVLAGLQDLKL